MINVIKQHLKDCKKLKKINSKYEKYLKKGDFGIDEDPYDISSTLEKMQLNRPNFIGLV